MNHGESQLRRLAAPLVAVIATLSVASYGESPPRDSASASASDSLLPRNVVLPLTEVGVFFPEVTQESSTGQNLSAVGNPKATRIVIYADSDSSKKVTISVDQYASSSDASSAYREAVNKSKEVPGLRADSGPDLGPDSFIAVVTQGTETHIGLGALIGPLVVAATVAGYDATSENTAKLISLTRKEEALSKAVLSP